MTTSISSLSPEELRARVIGRVIAPGDDDYDTARVVMSGAVDARPAAIVRVANADDVARVIAHARETGAELAVRAGGHSSAGHSTVEGGIVIDLRDLREIEIDPEARTMWAGGGLTAYDVTVAAAEHGLAVGFGDTGTVGIGGITLGGGIGYLVRKYGLTIDNLLGVEIVTADGRILTVDETSHPDLFWALRGGGGNFGVVTRFKYRLQPVRGVTGGVLVLPATPEVVAGFVAESEKAPEELSGIGNVMACPPMPFIDEQYHGTPVVIAMMCHVGDAEAGERAMAPFRALAQPLADMVRPIGYPEMYPPEEQDSDYHPTAVSRTMFVDRVGLDEAKAILDAIEASDAPMRGTQLRVLGGAASRVPEDATAFAHRSSRIMANVFSFYTGEEERPRREAWVDGLVAALQQEDRGAYVNFLGDEGQERVRAAYPEATWERLAAVKAIYDPENLFRRNQNVPPAR